jgi:hypothetical protein
MKLARKIVLAAICVCLYGAESSAQLKKSVETRNAALRYWIAFADLEDLPAEKATQDLLEKTAAGEASWDETKLGSIVEKNENAILGMQRATKLPECDWGLEYSRGPRASIAPVVKARILARLNTLYGMRLAAKGEAQQAVDTWLSGIRFSEDMAKGGSLIFALIAKMGMISNLNALQKAAESGKLSVAQKQQASAAIRALAEGGLDWGNALSYEEASLEVSVREMRQDPAGYFQEMMGRPAPAGFTAPNSAEVYEYEKKIAAAQAALRKPSVQTPKELSLLEDSLKSMHPFFREATPSFERINNARIELQSAREAALRALSAEPQK